MAKVINEKARQTPVIKETEVLVADGGPGGFAAAVSAARAGAQCTCRDMPISLVFRLGGIDWNSFGAYVKSHTQEYGELRQYWEKTVGVRLPTLDVRDARGFAWCNFWGPSGCSGLSPSDLTAVEKQFRRAIMESVDHLRRQVPGMSSVFVVDTASQIGTRDSRRNVGRHCICSDGMDKARAFRDAIGKGTKSALRQPILDIPYGCIVPRGPANQLVSGRCACIADDAYKCMQLITPCLVLGQGAGVAAALAVQGRVSPARVDVQALHKALRQQGVPLGSD